MTYQNILSNPYLESDDQRIQTVHELDHPPQYIWSVSGYDDTTVRHTQPGLIDQHPDVWDIPSVIPDNGTYTINAAYKTFMLNMHRTNLALRNGQRYLFKLTVTPALALTSGATNSVAIRFGVQFRNTEGKSVQRYFPWHDLDQWGDTMEIAYDLIQCNTSDADVDFTFEVWSKFGNYDGKIQLHSLQLLEVPVDYGDDNPDAILHIGVSDDEPDDKPTPFNWTFIAAGVVAVIVALLVAAVAYFVGRNQISALSAGVEIMDMNDLLQTLFAIPALAVISYSGGLIYVLVELWKRYVVDRLPAILQAKPEVVTVILVAFFIGAHGLAVELQYDSILKDAVIVITDLVNVVGPYILGGIVGNAAISYGYDKARANNVPGFGYKSTK